MKRNGIIAAIAGFAAIAMLTTGTFALFTDRELGTFSTDTGTLDIEIESVSDLKDEDGMGMIYSRESRPFEIQVKNNGSLSADVRCIVKMNYEMTFNDYNNSSALNNASSSSTITTTTESFHNCENNTIPSLALYSVGDITPSSRTSTGAYTDYDKTTGKRYTAEGTNYSYTPAAFVSTDVVPYGLKDANTKTSIDLDLTYNTYTIYKTSQQLLVNEKASQLYYLSEQVIDGSNQIDSTDSLLVETPQTTQTFSSVLYCRELHNEQNDNPSNEMEFNSFFTSSTKVYFTIVVEAKQHRNTDTEWVEVDTETFEYNGFNFKAVKDLEDETYSSDTSAAAEPFTYTLNADGTYNIDSFNLEAYIKANPSCVNGTNYTVNVPTLYNNKRVYGINPGAFYNTMNGDYSVTLNIYNNVVDRSGIAYIGAYAFANNKSLKTINVG